MKKKFLSNLFLLLLLNLLIKPFWILGIDRTVQNVVGAQDYGFYFVIFNFSFLFNILLDFGITNFNNRNIAQNHHLLNKYFSGIVVIKFLLAVFYTAVTFTFALLIGFNAAQMNLLGFMCLNQFLLSFILYLRSNISGLLLFRTESFLSVFDRILMIIICSVLLWGHVTTEHFRIEWFVYAQSAAYFLTAITALIIVIRKASFRKLSWNFPFFIIIMKQSFPFAILVMLMAFYNRIDPVMINRLLPGQLGESEAGIYASAYRLLDAGNMIAYLFAVLLLPLFSNMIKKNEPIVHLAKLSFTLLIIVSVVVASGSFFYSYELMDLLYTDHVPESAEVFRILMLGFVAISTTYVFGTLLTANGNLKALNMIAGGGMLLNLSINFLLVPRMMAVGSAYASVVTQFSTALVQVWFATRVFKFETDFKYLLRLGLFVVGTLLINLLSKYIFVNWIFNFISMIFFTGILALALRLIKTGSVLSFLKTKERTNDA